MGKKTQVMDVVLKDVTEAECLILNSLLRDNVSRIQNKRKVDMYDVRNYDTYFKFNKIFWENTKLFEKGKNGKTPHSIKNVSNKIPVSKKVIL